MVNTLGSVYGKQCVRRFVMRWEVHLVETGPHLKKARCIERLFFSSSPTNKMLKPYIKKAQLSIGRDVVGIVRFSPVWEN